jgi:hypothetical protein
VLLLVLIWSFHIQYMQPPSFSLTATTLLSVFIFIALRALGVDAGYVLPHRVRCGGGLGGARRLRACREPGRRGYPDRILVGSWISVASWRQPTTSRLARSLRCWRSISHG